MIANRNYSSWSLPPWLVMTTLGIAFETRAIAFGPAVAGDAFTAVDAFYAPVAFRLQTYGLTMGEAGHADAARLLALSAMPQWYVQALAEDWRDAPHEAEILAVGTVTVDRRAAPGA